jgi:hypothetical protein
VTDYSGIGGVDFHDDRVVLKTGTDLTGITWNNSEELPQDDYELSFEARRISGSDIFCGLTFPVGNSHCSLILGGWGGGASAGYQALMVSTHPRTKQRVSEISKIVAGIEGESR